MKLPLIVNEHGSIDFFRSAEQMTSYLEAIDVKNDEYVVYDSEGRLVELGVERIPKRLFKIELVIIKSVEPSPDHAEELAGLLRNVCLHFGDSKEWVANATLTDLINKCYKKHLVR